MKRKKFISAALTTALMPLLDNAFGTPPKKLSGKGFKVNKGELYGHIKLKGVNSNILDLKISGSDNGGNMAIFEQTSISQGMGTPFHVHHRQDEVFYVLEGEYFFKVGEVEYHMSAGDSIFMPMKVPHVWTQVSKTGRMLVVFQPAGKMENFFNTVASLIKPPSPAELAKIFADNEMQIVGPPLKIR